MISEIIQERASHLLYVVEDPHDLYSNENVGRYFMSLRQANKVPGELDPFGPFKEKFFDPRKRHYLSLRISVNDLSATSLVYVNDLAEIGKIVKLHIFSLISDN